MSERRAQIAADIEAAYRWILGRPVDPGGLDDYAVKIETGVLDLPTLRLALLGSEEFTQTTSQTLALADVSEGMKVVFDPADPDFGRHLAAGSGWEPHIANAIKARLEPGSTFVDIGANIGVMSFPAAARIGPPGKVIAFEPNPQNAALFRRGIAANGLDNVRLFTFGLSDHAHMISLSSASNAKVMGEAKALQDMEVVQAIAGDEILLKEERIDLIKIDVEGFEQRVLQGLSGTIAAFGPKILCEFNPLCLRAQGGIEPETLADHLFSLAPRGELVEQDGSFTPVASTGELMAIWARRDAESTQKGLLPQGWVHFDILLDAAR
ncbi:FkbM family methyltransferase [Sphingomonas sp. H39-1-10]|uniref:FkbM family methyltransferase n=1 Tax=Sphingomonas pollutisoli TaxID=3030829 RepID=UPI0023B95728|nr:FkbM family methyltransferase [Sphingomonas pollutisoli]MDF0490489.1 FkbM family methyltransferase [Sphingomonas pollutisoli]